MIYELLSIPVSPPLKVSMAILYEFDLIPDILWIGLNISCAHPDWMGLDWIHHKIMGWIGLGGQKWTHVQLWSDNLCIKYTQCSLVSIYATADFREAISMSKRRGCRKMFAVSLC